ncbi:CvpA family protein [Thalassospira sp.]|uniref:CvpA family protein n=1 Tax=Thalassospira sp. TaxID=1912094 RepID=UPI0027358408|nr:CvpA family protein [Thalassospira sp.]MDP2700036.1 CvpA family protein [Thalassospira sp.]
MPDLGARDVFDLVIVGIVLLSGLFAFFRGFVHETLSMLGWVGAGMTALYGYPVVRPYIRDLIPSQLIADLATAVGLFLIAYLVFSFISGRIAKAVQGSGLDSLDSTLGFVFGLVRGGVLVSIAFLALSWFLPTPQQPAWVRDARTTPVLEEGAFLLKQAMPDSLFDTTAEEISRTQQEADAREQTYRQLLGPTPKGTGPETLKGYTTPSRDDMDRLIEATTINE